MIAISIVSHGHGVMVNTLVEALLAYPEVRQLLVTLNLPERFPEFLDQRVLVIRNDSPVGFGANHNAAFLLCKQPFFCPLNPDIALPANPFPKLLRCALDTGAALVAPMVLSPNGGIEDSMRHFPTVRLLVAKALGSGGGRYEVAVGASNFCPDWVAGMFMMFRSEDFARLKGFDQGFFLYYEDVDICVRAWRAGMRVVACPAVSVVHDARRESHRSFGYLRWHLASVGRFFVKHWGRLPKVPDSLESQ